jgi:lipoyl(octanoyl) transferase
LCSDTAIQVRQLGRVDYVSALEQMQAFTDQRSASTADELWLVEHPPVFTLGLNADASHVLDAGDIPVVQVDRGGQVTYHGPGQLVAYVLVDVRRKRLGVRELVMRLERAVMDTLLGFGIDSRCRREAPGVYVGERKIASLGLRIRRGASYHGLALNVAMDLRPFERINPCGYRGLEVTQVSDLGGPAELEKVAGELTPRLLEQLERAA